MLLHSRCAFHVRSGQTCPPSVLSASFELCGRFWFRLDGCVSRGCFRVEVKVSNVSYGTKAPRPSKAETEGSDHLTAIVRRTLLSAQW